MGRLLARAAHERALAQAWEEVRANDLADGNKSDGVREFEFGAMAKLVDLGEQLLNGRYTPGPVTAIEVPKPSGGSRLLGIPTVADRVVERAVLAVIDPYLDPVLSPWCFAYRRGLGVSDAVHELVKARDSGHGWVARADIVDCFEEIPRWPVITRIRDLVPDAELCHLVQRLVTRPPVGPAAARFRAKRGRGLHQGSALSPVLSNLYLDHFDQAMLRNGIQVLRYADDLAIPAESAPAARTALRTAGEILGELGLALNEDKSTTVSFDEGVRFLGTTLGPEDGRRTANRVSPTQATLYVTQPGALVRSRGDRVRVEHNGETLFNANLKRVRQVVGVGRVGFTTPFLHRALDRGVELVLVDEIGRFRGRLASESTGDVHLRCAQYEAALDGAAAMKLARTFVAGKIANMRTGLLRTARGMDGVDISDVAARLVDARTATLTARGSTALLGVEGAASRDYFGSWGRLLTDWDFTHRRRRPPPDPVNAMLSFGYTLLLNDAIVACHVAGLDPEAGFLHTLRRGRASLALDLMEEFRPLIVDLVVARLALGNKVAPDGFEEPDADGCRMKPDTLKVFLAAYEKRMLTVARHPVLRRRLSYRAALTAQARLLAEAIKGERPTYPPLPWR